MYFRPFAKIEEPCTTCGPPALGDSGGPGNPVTFIIATGAITLALVWVARGIAGGKFGDACGDMDERIERARRHLREAERAGEPTAKLRSRLRAYEAARGAMTC